MKTTRRPQKNRKDGGKSLYLLLSIAGVGMYFLFRSLEPLVPSPNPAKVSAKAEKPKILLEPAPEKTEDTAKSSADLNARRLALIGATQVGISSVEVPVDGGYMDIPFQIIPQKVWCQGGDLDTIRYSVDNPMEKNLLVSIESLSGDFRQSSFKVSAEELFRGVQHKFKIKSFGVGDSLGLFICKNTQNSKTCQAKKLLSHKDIDEQIADEDKREGAKDLDYIYYFQSLVLGAKSVNIFRANDYLKTDRTALVEQLKQQFQLKEKNFNNAWKYSSVLQSLPSKIVGNTIILTLPYNDPRCTQMLK